MKGWRIEYDDSLVHDGEGIVPTPLSLYPSSASFRHYDDLVLVLITGPCQSTVEYCDYVVRVDGIPSYFDRSGSLPGHQR